MKVPAGRRSPAADAIEEPPAANDAVCLTARPAMNTTLQADDRFKRLTVPEPVGSVILMNVPWQQAAPVTGIPEAPR